MNISEEIKYSGLYQLLIRVCDPSIAEQLLRCVTVPEILVRPLGEQVSRAELAHALNMILFADLLKRVPEARLYVDEKQQNEQTVFLDHGAVRTVVGVDTGALPAGRRAFARFLEALGFYEKEVYPLDKIKMTGYAYCHKDYPEEIAQFFVSELNTALFSKQFNDACTNVLMTSVDPLDQPALERLAILRSDKQLSLEESCLLLTALSRCFNRHHSTPRLEDYQILAAESSEMAWIATEGSAYNHITDRVDDVQALSDEQKRLGLAMKETIEVSRRGTVRQTAYRATMVSREFLDSKGNTVTKTVPGSFIEFIDRAHIQLGEQTLLDLAFDASNAQGIFKMTEANQT